MTLSDRFTAALMGALFGSLIGLAVAWLAMFSATLHLLGIGSHAVSYETSAMTGAAFFATCGALFGSSTGTLVGLVLAGLFEFERLGDDRRRAWTIELVLLLVGIGVILWISGAL